MLTGTDRYQQTSFFGADLIDQLDPLDPLKQLSKVIPWQDFDHAFAGYYAEVEDDPAYPYG